MVKTLNLTIICAVIGCLSATADTLTLTGTIRDFSSSHPDFEKAIATEYGLVNSTLGSDGKPVYALNSGGTTTTSGKENFDQWYRDVPGVNESKQHAITLTKQASGVYTYANNAFFPIDGELLGNEGRSHNYHFTYELNTAFTYEAGQTFSFTGDDDLWVFINGQLVIDLGGVHGALSKSVNLDTLSLTPGNDYTLDLFFAERHTSESNFRIDTSIQLRPETVPDAGSTLALLSCALGALAAVRRKF